MIMTHTVTPTNTPDTKFARVKPSRVSAGLYSEKATKVDEISKLVLTILKVALSQKILENFYVSNINIPKQKI